MCAIFYGQNAEFSIISKSHGRSLLSFNEQFDVDTNLTNKRLYFFNSKESLAISVFEGVSGRFGYLETEEVVAQAALMDISPSAALINDDPSAYVEFSILMNAKDETGVVRNATFVKGCRITSAPESMTPREEQHVNISYIGGTRYKIKGGGIKYMRFVSSAPAYRTADDITISGSGPHSGTMTVSASSFNIENNTTTRSWLAYLRNGTDVAKTTAYTSGLSVSGTSAVFPSGTFADTTDVVELYVPYET